jgi:hypothetical protein
MKSSQLLILDECVNCLHEDFASAISVEDIDGSAVSPIPVPRTTLSDAFSYDRVSRTGLNQNFSGSEYESYGAPDV